MAPADVTETSPGRGRLAMFTVDQRQIGTSARPISGRAGGVDHRLATGRYQSPLRYPGAKSGLATVIGKLVESAKASPQFKEVDLLVEPFAGGAATSLRLVGAGIVDRVLLADADPLVAMFWQAAAADTEDLIDRMVDEYDRYVSPGGVVALDRWDFWRQWRPPAGLSNTIARREAAMKCLFLNRTTFSGILHGQAGPIGGRRQDSVYGIGCRFNVDSLKERLRYVGHLYQSHRLVDVWCKDWQETLGDIPEWYPQLIPNRVIAYLDPPYLEKSGKLYQRSFELSAYSNESQGTDVSWSSGQAHRRLADYVRRQIQFRWVLSYDAHPQLLSDTTFYANARMNPSQLDRVELGTKTWRISKRLVALNYTASARNGRGAAKELLLTTLPPGSVPLDDTFRPLTELFTPPPRSV